MVMKPFDYYGIADIPYPVKSAYVTIYVYSKGEILWRGRGGRIWPKFGNSIQMLLLKVILIKRLMGKGLGT
jgi:hypothetical protein